MTDSSSFCVETLVQLGRVSAIVPAPCGSWAAVEVHHLDQRESKYCAHLWRVSLDQSHEPLRLTQGDWQHRAPSFRQDGALGFLSNRPLPEKSKDKPVTQIWLYSQYGGDPTPLTDEPLGITAFGFAKEADVMVALTKVWPGVTHAEQRSYHEDRSEHGPSALHYKHGPVRFWDHWLEASQDQWLLFDGRGEGRQALSPDTPRNFKNAQWSLSPNGQHLVSTHQLPLQADRIYDIGLIHFDLRTTQATVLPQESKVWRQLPTISHDNQLLAFTQGRRFPDRADEITIHTLPLSAPDTTTAQPVAPTWTLRPLEMLWAPDQHNLVVAGHHRGQTPIFEIGLHDAAPRRCSAAHTAGSYQSLCWRPGTTQLLALHHSFFSPPEPCLLERGTDATPQPLAQLSGFSPKQAHDFAQCTEHWSEAQDGTKLHTRVLAPKDAKGPTPWVLWIHGGPVSAWVDGWHWRWNPLLAVAQGFAIAMPNPRGSTGYGQRMIDDIYNNRWGEACYDDLMQITDELAAMPVLHDTHYAAMGGSFGGYMTNWIGGHTTRFRCLITHASLFHFPMFYGTTDVPGWFALQSGGNPIENLDAVTRHSPHRFVQQWRTPTLIIHGGKDYRVPISEALFLFEALQTLGITSELLVFPDENHWIRKPRNIKHWYSRVFSYLQHHLQQKTT